MSTTNKPITTEWEDIHRRLGNFPELPEYVTEEKLTGEMVEVAESADVLEGKKLSELKELEDRVDEDTLLQYREKRLMELKEQQRKEKFGTLTHLGKDEFLKEVTEASKGDQQQRGGADGRADDDEDEYGGTFSRTRGVEQKKERDGVWVILHLYKDSDAVCRRLNTVFSELATKYKAVKFMKAISTDVIHDYPDHKLPVVLLYYGGTCQRQIVGADVWGGVNATSKGVAKTLADAFHVKALQAKQSSGDDDGSEDEEDGRQTRSKQFQRYGGVDAESEGERNEYQSRGYTSITFDKKVQKGW